MKRILRQGLKIISISLLSLALLILAFIAYRQWRFTQVPQELEPVANGDAIFWLMQKPTNRFMPCVVQYTFDKELDETIVLKRLKKLIGAYEMFHRNVVVIDGLPYWQKAEPDWGQNFKILDQTANLEEVRIQADLEISQAYELGEGLPLFRAYLSADRRELLFIWHHVISDFEGMFNKQAKHLFSLDRERTQFGYQIDNQSKKKSEGSYIVNQALEHLFDPKRKKGFTESGFEVKKFVLPLGDKALYDLGKKASLSMSDIFSFITTRAITHYHLDIQDPDTAYLRPILTPLSLRKSSLETDEGNNRAIKLFPLVFPLEPIEDMHQRITHISPAASSYETTGRNWKILRQVPFIESILIESSITDYISNYFPLADDVLSIDSAQVIAHHLRVPLSPYERAKFAWSNYNGEAQLYLHTDPKLLDQETMIRAFEKASKEVFQLLRNYP